MDEEGREDVYMEPYNARWIYISPKRRPVTFFLGWVINVILHIIQIIKKSFFKACTWAIEAVFILHPLFNNKIFPQKL